MKPYQQGSLDGLCGLYSIINALRLVTGHRGRKHSMHLLDQLVSALNAKYASTAFINGTTTPDLSYLLNHVISSGIPIKKTKPFHKNDKLSLPDFWREVQRFLSAKSRAVITTFETPSLSHWTVVQSAFNKKFVLFDSDGMICLYRSRCTTYEMRKKRPYLLYPTCTFFIS